MSAVGARLVFRELTAPSEAVALLRLRHRVYFEERGYGSPKPFGLDLTVHDTHARLYGVFRGAELLGGIRLVFRREQALATVLHTLRAVILGGIQTAPPSSLPSEEAFDLSQALGPRAALVDVEVGRLVVLRPGVDRETVLQIMIATVGLLLQLRCRFFLYSCARELAERYASVTNPRWTLLEPSAEGIVSDGFPFPKETVAAVAAPEDTHYFEQALAYARAFHEHGFAELSPPAASPVVLAGATAP